MRRNASGRQPKYVYIDSCHTCVVFRCSNRQNEAAKEKGISFFVRFSKESRKRRAWVKAINRADWVPNQFIRVCSCHFQDDPSVGNYRPTLFSFKEKVIPDSYISVPSYFSVSLVPLRTFR